MGVKIPRQKPKQLLLSIIYRLQKLLPLSSSSKLKLFLKLEWIFDRLAHEQSFKVYSVQEHPIRKFTKEFILENISSGDSVLDLGCNSGDLSFFISEKAKMVVGIDHDAMVIENAKRNYKKENLSFIHADALSYLKQNTQNFDVLILSHILEHLDEPQKFLNDFKTYFKRIYVELPDFDKSYLNHYRKDLGSSFIYTDDDHVSEFDRMEMIELLKACGLKIVKAEYRFGIQKIWCEV
jgi:SAM-dependent methyltransferase